MKMDSISMMMMMMILLIILNAVIKVNGIEEPTQTQLQDDQFNHLQNQIENLSISVKNLQRNHMLQGNVLPMHIQRTSDSRYLMIIIVGLIMVIFIYLFKKSPRLRLYRDTCLAKLDQRLRKFEVIDRVSKKIRGTRGRQMKSTSSDYGPSFSVDSPPVEMKQVTQLVGFSASYRPLISESAMRSLAKSLPMQFLYKNWKLMYSSDLHGYDLHSAYEHASNRGPFVLVVMDANRYVFGAFCNEDFHNSQKTYFGSGESFIFRLYPNFRVFRWAGKNDQICVTSNSMIAFGGAGKFALWLDDTFSQGSSEKGSSTFEPYVCLASQEMFKCCKVEIWGFQSMLESKRGATKGFTSNI